MNPLMNNFGGGNPFGNIMNLMQQVSQLKQSLNGNPQQMAQGLLQSGKVSQDFYNQKYQEAMQIFQMVKGMR